MAEKKIKKKTLVLTMGSPSKKGGKKNPGINPGQHHLKYTEAGSAIHSEPTENGREKKTPRVLTLGSPPEKGGKKNPWY
jgi:hypothetical protein